MKTKRVLPLLAMLAAGSMLCLSGCSVDVTTINEEEMSIEEAVEEEDLAEGTVLFHSIWYDADGEKLPNAEVAFYEDETLAFSGTTEDDGSLEAFSLPCNTTLFCSVTDEDGNPIAETDVVIKLSDNYESPTIYPARDIVSEEEENPTLVLEIPTDNVDLRGAFFVTESGAVNIASLTAYLEEETEEAVEEETEEAAEEQPAEEQPAEEQPAEEQSAEEQATAEQPAAEQPAEEQATAEQPAEEQATAEQPAEEQATAEQPAAEQPAAEQPAA